MDKKKRILFGAFLLILLSLPTFGASVKIIEPIVGQPCPDFKFTNVKHFSRSEASISDFKGKWLFIDFWFTGCVNCIRSFPKVNQLQSDFSDQIQFLLVGMNDNQYNKGIEPFYERMRTKMKLNLPIAFDSVLIGKWNISSMPHIVIVNPDGIVFSITSGRDLNSAKIQDLLSGKSVFFYPKDQDSSKVEKIKAEQQSSQNSEDEDGVIYKSQLTKWNGSGQSAPAISTYLKYIDKHGFKISMIPLYALFNYAYVGKWGWASRNDSLFGKIYPTPILENDKLKLFEYDYNINIGKGTYNYTLDLPKNKQYEVTDIMNIMQTDLKNIFGFTVVVENRQMPVWQVITNSRSSEKLVTKGGERTFKEAAFGEAGGFSAKNIPFEQFLDLSIKYVRDSEPQFFNCTNLSNIDVNVKSGPTDMNELKKMFNSLGLDLIKGTKEMKVIIIRD